MSKGTDNFVFLCLNQESKILSKTNDPINNRYNFTSEDKKFEVGTKSLCAHYKSVVDELELSEDDLDPLIKPTIAFLLDVQKLAEVTREFLTPDDYTDDGSPWRILEIELEEQIPDFNNHMFDYVKWSYSKTSKNPQMKVNPEAKAPSDNYMQSSASIKDRFNKRFNQEPKANNRNFQQHTNNRHDRPNHKRNNRNQSNNRGKPQRTREEKNEFYQKKAMDDAKKAILRMNDDQSIDKVALRPVNSFFRRLQHQLISDSKLFSKSQGEGRDRCIVILRDENQAEEA